MALAFRFPDVGEGITEGEIVRWLVALGERIRADQPLVEVETDKAVVEIPAPRDGTILQMPLAAGDKVQVGDVLVVIGEPGESAAASAPAPSRNTKAAASVSVVGRLDATSTELPPSPEMTPSAPTAPARRVLAIPSVRKLARDLGVDLARVTPSGPQNRIRRADVLQAAPAAGVETPPPAAPATEVGEARDAYGPITLQPVSALQRSMARTMVTAATTAVPVTTTDEVDVTDLVAWRERSRAMASETHLTLLPFIMKAVLAALRQHPALNASLAEDQQHLIVKRYYHFGIATDTPEGLMVPVIKDVAHKNILTLASELQRLTELARQRRIALSDLRGGTFTISNYGAIGGIFATPMLIRPQVAILGLGKLLHKPVVCQGEVVVRTILPLSLTFDHCALDGASAQRFVNDLMTYLADPMRLVVVV